MEHRCRDMPPIKEYSFTLNFSFMSTPPDPQLKFSSYIFEGALGIRYKNEILVPNFSEQVTIQYSYVVTYSAVLSGGSAPTSMPPITKNVISKSTMIKITAYHHLNSVWKYLTSCPGPLFITTPRAWVQSYKVPLPRLYHQDRW